MKLKNCYILALLLCVLTSLNFISPYALASEMANETAGDYRSVHNEHLRKVEKLPEVVEQVFALNDIEAGEPAFIVDDFFDPERIKLRIQLKVLFSLARDLNTDMKALSVYGLNRLESGTYTLDRKNIPQWGSASDLFYDLSLPEYFDENAKNQLRKMGLSNKDFELIDDYIHNHNIHIQIDNIILDSLGHIEKRIKHAKSKNIKTGLAFNYSSKLDIKIEQAWYQWIKNLLVKFPRIKQQAIINYGANSLGFTHISASKSNEISLGYFAKRIESGEIRKQSNRRIKMIQAKINGEEQNNEN